MSRRAPLSHVTPKDDIMRPTPAPQSHQRSVPTSIMNNMSSQVSSMCLETSSQHDKKRATTNASPTLGTQRDPILLYDDEDMRDVPGQAQLQSVSHPTANAIPETSTISQTANSTSAHLPLFGENFGPITIRGDVRAIEILTQAVQVDGLYFASDASATESDAFHAATEAFVRARVLPNKENHGESFGLLRLSEYELLCLGIEREDFKVNKEDSIQDLAEPPFLFGEQNLDFVLAALKVMAKYLSDTPANPGYSWALGVVTIDNGVLTTQVFSSQPDAQAKHVLWMAREIAYSSDGSYTEKWRGSYRQSTTLHRRKSTAPEVGLDIDFRLVGITDDELINSKLVPKNITSAMLLQLSQSRSSTKLYALWTKWHEELGMKVCDKSNLTHRVSAALKKHPAGEDAASAALSKARDTNGVATGNRHNANVGGKISKQIASLRRKGQHEEADLLEAKLKAANAAKTKKSSSRKRKAADMDDEDILMDGEETDEEILDDDADTDDEENAPAPITTRQTRSRNSAVSYKQMLQAHDDDEGEEEEEEEEQPRSKRRRVAKDDDSEGEAGDSDSDEYMEED